MGRGITGNYLNARIILFLRSLVLRKVRSQDVQYSEDNKKFLFICLLSLLLTAEKKTLHQSMRS